MGRTASAPTGARADPRRVPWALPPARPSGHVQLPQAQPPPLTSSLSDLLPPLTSSLKARNPGAATPASRRARQRPQDSGPMVPAGAAQSWVPVPAPLLADPALSAVGADTACGGTGPSGSNSARATPRMGASPCPPGPAPAPPSWASYLVAFARGAPDAIGDARGLIHVQRSWGASSPPSKLAGARRWRGGRLSRGSGARGWPRVGPRGLAAQARGTRSPAAGKPLLDPQGAGRPLRGRSARAASPGPVCSDQKPQQVPGGP